MTPCHNIFVYVCVCVSNVHCVVVVLILVQHCRFLQTVQPCLQIDERVASDTLRLVDTLLIVVFEGRSALPRTKYRPPVDEGRSHRAIVEAIRNKDTDAVIDAVEQGHVDVNHTDDVGQTLLNWAAAFG